MERVQEIIRELALIADKPNEYVTRWKQTRQAKAVGILPMNFPAELIHAAGALPSLVQEDDVPITVGRSLLFEFYCGYTRSLTDRAARGDLDVFDGLFLVDHCVALLGAVDAIRFAVPDMPVYLAQFTASMDEPWAPAEIRERVGDLRERLGQLCGTEISGEALRRSIALYNHNRGLVRHIYDLRRTGAIALTSSEMQVLVKSAMVMDIEEHSARLADLIEALEEGVAAPSRLVRLHLSGHFCHAPRPELLAIIEGCGATIVNDDLFTGYRYISTDVPSLADPLDALTQWYFDRNTNMPCSTRAQNSVDWEDVLMRSLPESRAQGVVVLMPKFCEPHMLYYPELRKAFIASNTPYLLIETEHEGMAVEHLRVRVEAFIEVIKRGVMASPELS